jgi:hypothetical protein
MSTEHERRHVFQSFVGIFLFIFSPRCMKCTAIVLRPPLLRAQPCTVSRRGPHLRPSVCCVGEDEARRGGVVVAPKNSHPAHGVSSAHAFSLRTCSSSAGVKSFWMLNCARISSGVLPVIIFATVLQVRSSIGLMSRKLAACVVVVVACV